jgi:hypothetical protein
MTLKRRQFLLSLPFFVNFKTKKMVEVIVEEKNNVGFIYVEEQDLKSMFNCLARDYPFSNCFEINYDSKNRYLLKKFENRIPFIIGLTIWTIQSWNYNNKTWNEIGEFFCFNF